MAVLTPARPAPQSQSAVDNGAEVLRAYRARLLREVEEIDRELAQLEK